MVRRGNVSSSPKVFPVPVFEIRPEHPGLPVTKEELLPLIKNQTVVVFHKSMCKECHSFPGMEEWMKEESVKPGMGVTAVGRRTKPFHHWEPIHIGTNQEPLFDERLTWEGRSDKMVQSFKMCLLGYQFHVLDNAFLIHRPGIKTNQERIKFLDQKKVTSQTNLQKTVIYPEVKKLFGNNESIAACS